jgi:exosortase A-associated hydrolase 1
MSATCETLVFPCGEARLAGVLHRPEQAGSRGVVIVVGGPQYRVGSHRQFVLLARHLAAAGFPVLRFDCRGMGDSTGEFPGFEAIGPDIAAAVQALRDAVPGLRDVVLWGLCDGASAAVFQAARAPGAVAGLVLANPWVRTEAGLARSYVRSYYGRRLLQRDFWVRLFSGQMNPGAALLGFLRDLGRSLGGGRQSGSNGEGSGDPAAGGSLPDRFRAALQAYPGPVQLLLSGADLTAREFESCLSSAAWDAIRRRPGIRRLDLPGADHTFSRREWTDAVSAATLEWLRSW